LILSNYSAIFNFTATRFNDPLKNKGIGITMLESQKNKFSTLDQAIFNLEELYINELEDMLYSRLIEDKRIELNGNVKETIEFAGKTNYKIRLRRPNKNVWAIPFKDFREAIRVVLRIGTHKLKVKENLGYSPSHEIKYATSLLLNILPEKEYQQRSFVGKRVVHPKWGEGKILSISESGNADVQFRDRVVRLKPNFIKLK
jgi:hypothetical protein